MKEREPGGRGRRRGRLAVLAGAVVAAAVAWLAVEVKRHPLVNDITTTPEAPPAFRAAAGLPANAGRDLAYPGGRVADAQRRAYPDLAPLEVARPPAEVLELVRRTAAAMPGWTVTAVDEAEHRLEAVAVTRLLRFRDDVVVEVRPTAAGTVVHVRSRSRVGRGDFGANAARIRAFLSRLRAVASPPPDPRASRHPRLGGAAV